MVMAKKPKSTTEALNKLGDGIAKVASAQEGLMRNLASEQSALDATFQSITATSEAAPQEKKLVRWVANVKDKNTKSHRVAVDLGGGVTAQASTELINLGVRALGRWSPESWVGQNSDVLQGAPHVVLGLGIYIAEMASRKNMELPSTTREVMSEASKLFAQLGFSNLVRALRVRYGDGKQKDLDLAALGAEKAELERRVLALQQQAKK